jgi:SAM-dependent methyltransferase
MAERPFIITTAPPAVDSHDFRGVERPGRDTSQTPIATLGALLARQRHRYSPPEPSSSVLATVDGENPPTLDLIYRAAERGAACWTRNHRGQVRELPMTRWIGGPEATSTDRLADDHILAHCVGGGPTLDLGCGPGRFAAALQHRGCAALGVDSSQAAVDLTRARGGVAIRADLFGSLPAEGCWDQILLADGNIGIGGDPARMVRRVAELLSPGGVVVAEIESHSVAVGYEMLRWETEHHVGHWFPWSRVGALGVGAVAGSAGLRVRSVVDVGSRIIVVLAADTSS